MSVRSRLVILLAVVGFVPLLTALLFIAITGRAMRTESFSQTIRSVAAAEAMAMEMALAATIEKTQLAVHETTAIRALKAVTREFKPEELERLDARWPSLTPRDKPLADILTNRTSEILRLIQREDPGIRELLLTDRFGQLLAATGKTDDYYQGDEPWWTNTLNNGQPQVFIPQINLDRSSGVWNVSLCIPIVQDGEFLGVAKAVMDLGQWMGPSRRMVGDLSVGRMLTTHTGLIVHREGLPPMRVIAEDWSPELAQADRPGSRISGDEIQAYAPIRLGEEIGFYNVKMPSWTLVLYAPKQQALGAVHKLTLYVLGVGLAVIATLFIAGMALADRIVISRVRKLYHAMRHIGQGDLAYRLAGTWPKPLAGRDEIDELAGGFDQMAQQIQKTHAELTQANQLKMDFIRIASHELRTPVAYILGMAKLLKDGADADRLLQAVQSMGAKAKRLEEIIQAMFKLMPDQRFGEQMRYSQVSISELLEDLYLDVLPFIERRGQRLVFDVGEPGLTLQADRDKLLDLLENLVINAIKFTPDGGTLRLRAGQVLGGYVTFNVIDQGPGIPDSEMAHLFSPFYSGGDVMQHSTGESGFQKRGMGLGLAIVKHFVQMHGGSINVATGPTGSTFTVTLPLERPSQAARPDQPR